MSVSLNPSWKWLDRLRLSKGFPAGDDPGLDHFLSHQETHFPNPPNHVLTSVKDQTLIDKTSNSNSNELSSVLYELFNFGESNRDPQFKSKKGTRKQKKPRFCVVSNRGDEKESEVFRMMREENGDVDEKGSCDFVGFSRTQVTVIDTSYPWWKCERVVFRKKNLWRVRDRKSKSIMIGLKKRKEKSLEDENDESRKKSKLCGSLKGNKQNEKMIISAGESRVNLSQVQNQRFPRKSKKGGSSDVLMKKRMSKKNVLAPVKVAGS